MQKIETIDQFEQLLTKEDRFFFLKHSLTCPISSNSFFEYQSFLNEHPEESGYYLAVQDSRELSNYIAEKFAIRHESPQVFLFIDGHPGWHESHWNITNDQLRNI